MVPSEYFLTTNWLHTFRDDCSLPDVHLAHKIIRFTDEADPAKKRLEQSEVSTTHAMVDDDTDQTQSETSEQPSSNTATTVNEPKASEALDQVRRLFFCKLLHSTFFFKLIKTYV